MSFEYKIVGAPEKGKRKRGARTASERVAAAFEEILEAEAVDGWEYMRTDILPVVERNSLFGRRQEAHRAVMVFRRALAAAQRRQEPAVADRPKTRDEGDLQLRAEPKQEPETPRVGRREPGVSADPDRRLAEVVRGPGQNTTGEE